MGFFDFLFKKKVEQLKQISFHPPGWNNVYFGNTTPVYPNPERYDIARTYSTIDDVYSIVNKISSVTAAIDFYPYLEKNDTDVSKYRKIRKHLPKPVHEAIRRKALVDVSENDIVYDLLNNPSESLSKIEFYKACICFFITHGECILLKDKIELGVNAGKYRQFNILYPQYVNIRVSEGYPKQIVSYDYVVNGHKIHENIPAENVIHIRDLNIEYDAYGGELRGLSKLKVAIRRLARLNSNMDVSVAQMQNGGTPSIVYDKEFDRTGSNEVISNRKDNFYRFINDKANKGVPYFASGEMGVIPLGLPLTDMEVTALADIDFDKLCNIWGISSTLFNSKAANTESNVKEQKASMYTDVCLPILRHFLSVIEKHIRQDFDKPYILDVDVQSIPELQEDSKKMAETLSAAPIMVPAYVLEALGYGVDESDETLKQVYIKSGYNLLDDLQPVDDIDIDE